MAWACGSHRLAAVRGRERAFSRWSLSSGAALAAALALLWLPGEARAACAPASPVNNADVTCTDTTVNQNGTAGYGTFADTGNTITVVPGATVTGTNTGITFNTGTVLNSGSIAGGSDGIIALTTANVSNSGNITGGADGIFSLSTANVSNSGTIFGAGFGGIDAATSANVSNSGSISGGTFGINALTSANVDNSGSIQGGTTGINAVTANVTNSGSISGGAFGISAATATVSNSGIISGGTAALQFAGNPDTLTLLPGSTIIGAINLGGGGDTVNFRTGNQNLTFDTLAGATVTSTVPFVVSGNRVVTIDPTPFAMTDRNLMDFTRSVSSVLGDRFAGMGSVPAGPALGFAGESDANTRLADAFADIPGLSAYAADGAVFKNPTVQYTDGSTVWGRGFAGQRVQQADGDTLLHTLNQFYGGMIGGDWQAQANLRLGAFVGGGRTRSSEELNMGDQNSDLFFGGLFGRYDWGASFLGLALQGGHSNTDTSRNINNNLAPGGIETAKASYEGWYISPEAMYGFHYGLGALAGATYTLTPSVNLRYLYASFDGYTESGTTAPLTVGTQTVSDFEERAQLKLSRTQMFAPAEALMTHIYGGVLGVQRAGSTTVDATLLGQAIPFAVPGKDDLWGGFGGAGLEIRTGQVALFASAEYLALSDKSSVVSGQGGIRVAF